MRVRLAIALVVAGLGSIACAAPTPTSPPATPSPVQASPNPGLVEFETHIRESITSQGSLVRDLAAATTGSNDQLALAANHLEGWAADEQAWLDEHPAGACYENAWLTYQSGVEDVGTAASAFIALWQAVQEERLRPGAAVLIVAFGTGFTWGAALCRVTAD